MPHSLDDRRFFFVTGKGGVGKTTVTAATALAMADRGKRVLCAMCDTKERLSVLLGCPPIGTDVVSVRENLWAVRIAPETAMREYGLMILKSRTLYDAVFDNRYTRAFFAAVPGLYEWAMLGKAWYHSTEVTDRGDRRFDVVLFDAPATGHGLDMLRVPKVIVEVVPPGLLRREAERAWEMFRDPRESGVIVVTMPEDMPTNEALEIAERLENELRLPLARVVINGVLPELFTRAEREMLLAPRALDRSKPGDEALAAGVRRAIRERVQADSLERLDAGFSVEKIRLPLLFVEAATPEAVRGLARHL